MKTKMFLAVAILTLVGAGAFAVDSNFGASGADGKTGLSVEQMLNYAIQDEYLARSEYAAIMDRYGELRPFSNIIRAEEQHIEWLKDLFTAYGLSLPEDTSQARVAVPSDLRAALETGVTAELDNIGMYERFLGGAASSSLPADVHEVFERLQSASENHLRAFRTNLARHG